MKVKVMFNIELENIPKEIAERIDKLQRELLKCDVDLTILTNNLRTGTNIISALKDIEDWRFKLSEIDQSMAEYGNILAECQKASAQLYLKEETPFNGNEQSYLDPSDPTADLMPIQPEELLSEDYNKEEQK